MLNVEHVTKRYGKRSILQDVSAFFPTGVSLLVGPSGAGKSTLLRLCATAEHPSSGRMLWNDIPVKRQRRALRRRLGYAPQMVDLPGDVTGAEFMRHMAALKGVGNGAKEQARHLLDTLGLGESADAPINVYSGGMRRRLVFAQALLGTPQLLALDEPTAELDSDTAAIVTGLIQDAAKSATVLVTTHLTDQFKALGANTFRVADGQVTAI